MDNIVSLEGLKVSFAVQRGFLSRLLPGAKKFVHAVDGVSLDIHRGEIYGLVGESGSGKTTLGRAILRLVKPSEGKIVFEGCDISQLKEREVRPLRRRMQIVFQDPHAALNPAMTVGAAIAHPLMIHHEATNEAEARPKVFRMMDEVGLNPPEDFYDKLPAEMSGGQKQRVVIARAMILNPSFIVADEPVSMLDMSVRARILELLLDLKRRHNLSYLFITHDLATAKFLCNRIAIMYLGRIMEEGEASEVYADPKHPYTQALLGAIPIPDPERRTAKSLPRGEIPDAIRPPAGCRFHPRCPSVLPICGWEGRDFVDMLAQELEPEPRSIARWLGPPTAWNVQGLVATRYIGETEPRFVIGLVRSLLRYAPTPMQEAVADVAVEETVDGPHVAIRFGRQAPLLQKSLGHRMVECLLY